MITVIAEAANRALTTVERVKEQFQILGDVDDAYLARAVLKAGAHIERWCNRRFAWQTVTEALASNGGCELLLAKRPVVSVAAVAVCGEALDLAEVLLTDPEAGIIFRRSGFRSTAVHERFLISEQPSGYYAAPDWTVQYTAGFVCFGAAEEVAPAGVAALPEDLVGIATELVGIFYDDRARNVLLKTDSEGEASSDYRTLEEFLEDRAWMWRFRT